MVDEVSVAEPFPKVIFDQLPNTGLTSLEVKIALVAVKVPFILNAIPALNRISIPAGTVSVTPAFTVKVEVTM